MKNYSIDIFRVGRKGREPYARLEFSREGFTNREFKDYLLPSLLDIASKGKRYKHLEAVCMCEGKKFLTVRCDTYAEASTACLTMARPREVFRPLRSITLAR
jgi:hypothetical protein